MTQNEAAALVSKLWKPADGSLTIKLVGEVKTQLRTFSGGRTVERLVSDATIVFSGGKWGEHSLSVVASDRARIITHWFGYIEANGK